jgi:hypothetical protein
VLQVFAYPSKKPGLDTQGFIDYYENHHVPLVLSLAPAPPVYKRNYGVRGDELNRNEDTIDFDVVTELVFPDRTTFMLRCGSLSRCRLPSASTPDHLRRSPVCCHR